MSQEAEGQVQAMFLKLKTVHMFMNHLKLSDHLSDDILYPSGHHSIS